MVDINNVKHKFKSVTLDSMFEQTDSNNLSGILMLSPNELVPYPNNPFRLYVGKRLDDLIESIREYGILQPIIARKINDNYEILAGHNRHNVAILLNLEKVPVRVLEDIDDMTAELIVSESNFIQRSLADLKISERAYVISAKYNAEKRQGKRADLIKQVEEILENEKISKEDDILSPRMIRRYCRINTLIEGLKEKLDNGNIDIAAAVELSFLTKEEQGLIAEVNTKIDFAKAKKIRECSGDLTKEILVSILNAKKSRKRKIIVNEKLIEKFFKNNESESEISEIIRMALEHYFKE